MFGKQITLFRLMGFQVQVDTSWLFLAFLVTWSLATGYFPFEYKDQPFYTYWWMAIAGAVGLFASLIFHELAHSLVARRYGIPIKGITLFIFGGVAHMEEEPPSPKTEFLMAIAGPLSSILLATAFYGLLRAGATYEFSESVAGVVRYLAFINGLLAAFNLLPAFPLDGGRALRAALWGWKGDLRWATAHASRIGSGFGVVLIVMGVVNMFAGNFLAGFWWVLIGFFLRSAAGASYYQLLFRRMFEGEPVRRFMSPDPVTVSPDLSVQDLVDKYLYRYLHDMFPVSKDARVYGCITLRQVSDVPREEWPHKTVADLMTPCSSENTVQVDTDAVKALARMNRTGQSRLLVMEGDRLVGVIVLKDLLKLFALKMDLEGMGSSA